MSEFDRDKWNRIYQDGEQNIPVPARVLAEFEYLLPPSGRALDLACGRGGNAILLAQHGLETYAWDISDTAVEQFREFIRDKKLDITVRLCDAAGFPADPDSFDVIVVSRFLDRSLIPRIIGALRNQGLVFYQTFIKEKQEGIGPRNPDYLLDANELLSLFKSMHIILYREEGRVGNLSRGFRNEAMLIARKR